MHHFELIDKAEKEARKWAAEQMLLPDRENIPGWIYGAAEILEEMYAPHNSVPVQSDEVLRVRVDPAVTVKSNAMIREFMIRADVPDTRSWLDIMCDKTLNKYLGVFHRGVQVVQQTQVLLLNQVYSVLNFERYGRKVYEIAPGLGDQLVHTELRGLTTEDVQLPYESLYLSFPHNFPHKIWNEQTGWHDILGVYITEDPYAAIKTDLEDIEIARKGPRMRAWRFFIAGRSKNPDDPFDDALYHFGIRLYDGISLEQALNQHEEEEWGNMLDGMESMRSIWRPIFNFILNAMLYATWPDAEVDHVYVNKEAERLWRRLKKAKGTKAKKIKEKLKGISSQKAKMLGKSIRIDRTREISKTGTGSGQPQLVRTRVPGHWQHYWVGKGRSDRIRKFKRPYWKGGEGFVVSSPKHTLG